MYFTPSFYEAFSYLCGGPYYCFQGAIMLLVLLILCLYLWARASRCETPQQHIQSYSEGTEGYATNEYLANLDDAEFAGLDSRSSARIISWDLSSQISAEYEGFATKAPLLRSVVDLQCIGQGKFYSGIFKLVSCFQLPDGQFYRMTGTASAIDKFHASTSTHLMWHRKLGPAKWAVLIPDGRQHRYAERVKHCVAVACHANPIKSHKRQEKYAHNDFCVVALEAPFDSGVRFLPYHPEPSLFSNKMGLIFGFPKDMPDNDHSGKHLVLSKGSVSCNQKDGVLLIEHWANTVEGNSGGPVIVDNKIVGIHSMWLKDQKHNAAAPVNQNGNNIDEFRGVLRYMRGQHPNLPEDVNELGETKVVSHPGRVLNLYS